MFCGRDVMREKFPDWFSSEMFCKRFSEDAFCDETFCWISEMFS